jgi:excisionase family DNA binding protein
VSIEVEVVNALEAEAETMGVLLTPAEVAKMFGLTPETVRGWERRGLLRAIKTPTGRRLFRARDVERFLSERAARRALREAATTATPA